MGGGKLAGSLKKVTLVNPVWALSGKNGRSEKWQNGKAGGGGLNDRNGKTVKPVGALKN